MATLPLVPKQMDALIQAITLNMGLQLSYDPNPNNPDSPNNPDYNPLAPPPNYYGVRCGWQRRGQPFPGIDEDVVVVREVEIDDQYNRIRDVHYEETSSGSEPSEIEFLGSATGATAGTLLNPVVEIPYISLSGSTLLLFTSSDEGGQGTVTSIADSSGNIWKRLLVLNAPAHDYECWYVVNASSIDQVEVEFSGGSVPCGYVAGISEYTGVSAIINPEGYQGTSNPLTISPVIQNAYDFIVAGFFIRTNPTFTSNEGNFRYNVTAVGTSLGCADNTSSAAGTSVPIGVESSLTQQWRAISVELVAAPGAPAGGIVTKITNYTRVWEVYFTVYGPNSFDNARKIRSRLFDQDIHDQFAQSQLYWVTDPPAPRRVPEFKDEQWWERVDFTARFNEFVTETYTAPVVQSAEIIVLNEEDAELFDITLPEA